MPDTQTSPERFKRLATGRVLKALREAAGLTQAELAEAAGYSGSGAAVAVSRIERGEVLPPPRRLDALADALSVEGLQLVQWIEAEAKREGSGSAHAAAAAKAQPSSGIGGLAREVAFGREAEMIRQRMRALQLRVEALESSNEEHLQRFREAQHLCAERLIQPFTEAAAAIADIPSHSTASGSVPQWSGANADVAQFKRAVESSLRRFAAVTCESIGASTALNDGAAFAAYSSMAAMGTATTGTVISALTGTAVANATLAALRGGSLATGGLKMAGGTALLKGVAAAPVLIAVGLAAVSQNRKARRQVLEESQRLMEAERQLRKAETQLAVVWRWLDRASDGMRAATACGVRDLRALRRSGAFAAEETTSWTQLEMADRAGFESVLSMVTIAVSVLSLPFFDALESAVPDNEATSDVAPWVEAVLSDAEEQLGLAT